ncbi:hypothetical protein EON73_04115 [bacterium]|nr:MAG: hypothetical protein EON73_04115 [bacterium]
MTSKVVGQLNSINYDSDFFESKPFPIPYFDNKELKVGFVEAKHQPYLDSADKVLENFIALSSVDKIKDSNIIYRYYSETLKLGYTIPLDIKTAKDIWKFVTPTEIIIHWDENSDFYLCVSCDCEWEEEHGLQLVFKNGQNLTRASEHDGHFTD